MKNRKILNGNELNECLFFFFFHSVGSSSSPSSRQSNPTPNSPRPELTTMTNVNVLDLQMNPQPTSLQHQPSGLSRESDEDNKKNLRVADNYDDNESISW